VALVALVIVGAAAVVGEPRRAGALMAPERLQLTLRVPAGCSPDALLQQVSDRYLAQADVIAVATAGKGLSLEATYAVRLHPGASPAELVDALNSLENVQSVSLERS
jgi:hypothetical protein